MKTRIKGTDIEFTLNGTKVGFIKEFTIEGDDAAVAGELAQLFGALFDNAPATPEPESKPRWKKGKR